MRHRFHVGRVDVYGVSAHLTHIERMRHLDHLPTSIDLPEQHTAYQ